MQQHSIALGRIASSSAGLKLLTSTAKQTTSPHLLVSKHRGEPPRALPTRCTGCTLTGAYGARERTSRFAYVSRTSLQLSSDVRICNIHCVKPYSCNQYVPQCVNMCSHVRTCACYPIWSYSALNLTEMMFCIATRSFSQPLAAHTLLTLRIAPLTTVTGIYRVGNQSSNDSYFQVRYHSPGAR